MSELGRLFYFFGTISGAFLLGSLIWEAAHRLFKGPPAVTFVEKKEAEDWDPFKHLADLGDKDSAGVSAPPGEPSTKLPEAPHKSQSETSWGDLIRQQAKSAPESPREIDLEPESPPKGGPM